MNGELATRMMMTTTTKKKKKKGRPSLLDLQKRSLKQQQKNQNQFPKRNPNSIFKSNRQSTRPQNHNFNSINDDDYGHQEEEEDDDDDERQQKKHKLLHGLDNFTGLNSFNNGRRKIRAGSDHMEEKVLKATDTQHGLPVESAGPTTPLPDKKLLVFILDRLQKKDTYEVFSEPVDPEELPDYHEIIAHPMDFSTVRKKLDGGAYAYLEEFEKDVFLICTNAMEYNAPDTIYFRQARSILELAKKDFENLRQDSDDSEPQPEAKVVRRGRPPKSLKMSLDYSPSDRIKSEFLSDATLANGGDNANWASAYNLRKGPANSVRFRPSDLVNRASHCSHAGETYSTSLSEWENEFPASIVRAVMKYGKKQFTIDENRRDSYKDSTASGHEPSVLMTFGGELKQLMVVGLNTEHGYARSLARFAADLGPVVWKIASKKIECVQPGGIKINTGWVGENEAAEQQQQSYMEKPKSPNNYISGDHSSMLISTTSSGSNSFAGNRYSLQSREDMETIKEINSQSDSNLENGTLGGIRHVPTSDIQSRPVIHSDMNSFSGSSGFGFNYLPQMGTVGLTREPGNARSDNSPTASQMFSMVRNNQQMVCSMPASGYDSSAGKLAECSSRLKTKNLSVIGSGSWLNTAVDPELLGDQHWQGLSTSHKQEYHTFAPDLNVRFLAPGSPISNLQIGIPQQPDLALQL